MRERDDHRSAGRSVATAYTEGVQQLRDLLRSSLGSSLAALTPLDRLATAWPVAAGHAIAERSYVVRLDDFVGYVEVNDAAWLPQLRELTPRLRADLARISGVPLTDILFVLPRSAVRPDGSSAGAPTP